MKKTFLALLIFTLLFTSCKKDPTDHPNNNSDLATINFTINFPAAFNPVSNSYVENNISLSNYYLQSNPHIEYFQDFRDVGSVKQKVYTFKGISPGTYEWSAYIRKSSSSLDYVKTNTNQINVSAGQTYNITINANDFY